MTAQHRLPYHDYVALLNLQVKAPLKIMMGQVHVSVTEACQEYFEKFRRHVYVTPKSYLSFIAGYKALYSKKLMFVQELASSINSGLQKMFEAKGDVNRMKVRTAGILLLNRQATLLQFVCGI